MQRTETALPGTLYDPLYPDSDGEPMSEIDLHILAVTLLREGLEDALPAGPTGAYVAANMMLYFQQGNPAGHPDPDVLVALRVGRHPRRSFRTWEEGTVPHVVFEIASERTHQVDRGEKRQAYESIGVPEYFLFDPEGRWHQPVLQGFRLVQGAYVALQPAADGSLVSAQLGLRLVPERTMLRLVDLRTGAPVPTRQERIEQERERADSERKRADDERERAEKAEKRVAELERLLEQLRGQAPPPA